MQIKINIENNDKTAFPLNYNYQLQSAIYRLLSYDKNFSENLHDIGFGYENSQKIFRLFTFGGLKGNYSIAGKKIIFKSDIILEIRSVSKKFCETLEKSIFNSKKIKLFDKTFRINMMEITDWHIEESNISIITSMPIVARLSSEDGKSIYYPPSSNKFYEIINNNFYSKYKSFYGEFPKSEINLISKGNSKKIVTKYKNIWITAYHGNFCLSGNIEYLNFLYDTGLGGKNPQGFGMFDLV